jgi:hypothetical protein
MKDMPLEVWRQDETKRNVEEDTRARNHSEHSETTVWR